MNKFKYEYVIQANYGYGWDDVDYHEKNAQGFKDAKHNLKLYRENEPSAQHRLITRRTLNK